MSLLAMSFGLRFCASENGRTEGGGRDSTLGPGNMAASGLSRRKPLARTGWAISLLLCTNELRKWCSGHIHVGPPFLAVSLFSLCSGDHWPRARTTASSLDSGCGLSHECAQDGCNVTCRSFKAHLKWKYGTFMGSIGLKRLPQKEFSQNIRISIYCQSLVMGGGSPG